MNRLHCWLRGHDYRWLRNIYGDEINDRAGSRTIYRSWWICEKCGGRQKRRELVRER
jgi:hypothetical protein